MKPPASRNDATTQSTTSSAQTSFWSALKAIQERQIIYMSVADVKFVQKPEHLLDIMHKVRLSPQHLQV